MAGTADLAWSEQAGKPSKEEKTWCAEDTSPTNQESFTPIRVTRGF